MVFFFFSKGHDEALNYSDESVTRPYCDAHIRINNVLACNELMELCSFSGKKIHPLQKFWSLRFNLKIVKGTGSETIIPQSIN